jgi:hypothetical protein
MEPDDDFSNDQLDFFDDLESSLEDEFDYSEEELEESESEDDLDFDEEE